jgi:hypothetical protein
VPNFITNFWSFCIEITNVRAEGACRPLVILLNLTNTKIKGAPETPDSFWNEITFYGKVENFY